MKIDFEKVFDSVNWKFMFQASERFGVRAKFISWIRNYYWEVRMSILVSGSPTREFSPSCGLRQGDPISSLLFNLVVEVLSPLILKAKQIGFFRGVKLADNGYEVTHIQFADDILIFINNDEHSIKAVKNILLSL